MPEATPNPELENAIAEPQGQGSEDEAVAALLKKDGIDAAEPENEPAAESDEEPAEGEPAAEEATEALVEAELEGKTYKVAPEVEKALLRQADYSRKMNEVGTKDKALTQRLEQAEKLVQGAEKYAEVLSQVKGIDAQIKRFESLDWGKVRNENPAEYAALSADFNTLRLNKEQAQQRAKGINAEIDEARNAVSADKRKEQTEVMTKVLDKELPGWQGDAGQKLTQYAVSKGYTPEQIGAKALDDPLWAVAMDKARKFDALQTGKAAIKAQAQDAPKVLKPGAPRTNDSKSDAMARLRKSKSSEDAVAAFLARQ